MPSSTFEYGKEVVGSRPRLYQRLSLSLYVFVEKIVGVHIETERTVIDLRHPKVLQID